MAIISSLDHPKVTKENQEGFYVSSLHFIERFKLPLILSNRAGYLMDVWAIRRGRIQLVLSRHFKQQGLVQLCPLEQQIIVYHNTPYFKTFKLVI